MLGMRVTVMGGVHNKGLGIWSWERFRNPWFV